MTERPLTEAERALILHLLSVPFDGVDDLRAQADRAVATSSPGPGLELAVPGVAVHSGGASGLAPLVAEVTDALGSYLGELLLWLVDGRLSSVEYAWVTDLPPGSLPAVRDVRVAAKAS